MQRHALRRRALLFAALGVAAAHADTPAPDTSSWKCQQCPFLQGYTAEVEAGALYADGANASSGRYTGIDHNGVYADAGASGQWAGADGAYATYALDNLGIASRDGSIDAGQQGRYDVRIGYQGQPSRLYDTTATPFTGAGSAQLSLPSNWQAAGSTGAMTQLASSLRPFNIESDRRTATLFAEFFPSPAWTVYGDFSHQEKDGTGLTSASFLTDAVQLVEPIDYVTNSFVAGAAWAGRIASVRIAYTGSWFTDGNDSLTWSNPYLPVVPGAIEGRLALPPSNNLQQLSASGELKVPYWAATTLTYSASVGELKQDAAFLPISTLAGATALSQSSLDGDVHVSHYSLALASRPASKLYIRGTATYDGRDDHTAPLGIAYTVTDALPGGTAVTPRYGEDRARLDGSADYQFLPWVRLGVGGDFIHTHFAPEEVLTSTQETRSWVQATLSPLPSLNVTLKGGDARREASSFDVAALPPNENPLIRAYNFAPRDQTFLSLSGSWELTSKLSWALQGTFGDDAYRLSQLGLLNGQDRNIATTLTWTPQEKLSLYVNAGYQRLTALQRGENAAAAVPWEVNNGQHYWNTGAGGRWTINGHWDLSLDDVHSTSTANTGVLAGGMAQAFPQNQTHLDSVWLNTTYRWTSALRLRFRYGHEKCDSNDWALDEVGPATVPNLLAVGAQPFHHDVDTFALTALYQFGSHGSARSQ